MSRPGGPPTAGDPDLLATEAPQVEEALRALAAAVRSYRLYEGSNPMLDRFVTTLQQKIAALWERLPLLRLGIDEDQIVWEGQPVFPTGDGTSDLPFLLYKDGIRELTLLPGFEEEEVLAVLGVLARAPSIQKDEDDLITLLWQEDLTKLRYRAVEAGGEGAAVGVSEAAAPQAIDPTSVRQSATESDSITTEDFQESLYFLDEAELRRLREEVRRENERDLWADVLNALLDRVEDGAEDRQMRIVGILSELLPSALATAEFGRAASLLQQLIELASKPGLLSPSAVREVRDLFERLGRDETVAQLAEILEEMPSRLGEDAVIQLLGYFPPRSIGAFMSAADRVQRPEVKRAFASCIQRLAESNREAVVELLGSDDPAVLTGSLRWIGRLEVGSAVSDVVRFLGHRNPEVRVAAVEALVSLRAAAAAGGLIPLLEDGDRNVRIASARALGALTYVPARAALENALSDKRIRDADRNEKVAFFEAYGRLAGPEGVPILDKILNTRRWLGRSESADTRASTALALAKIRHPSARAALDSAANDTDPVVRSAVARALRAEAAP